MSRSPCIAAAITGVNPFLSARSTTAPASRSRRAVFQSCCDVAINNGVRPCPSRPFGSTRSIRHKSMSGFALNRDGPHQFVRGNGDARRRFRPDGDYPQSNQNQGYNARS